jgi:putative membrane protein
MMGGFDGMMDGMMGGWGGYGLAGGPINALLLVALLGIVAWALASVLSNRRPQGASFANRRDAAEEVLRERFARGELSAGEFERALRILRGEPVHENYEDLVREARER